MSDQSAFFTPKTPEKLVCFYARSDSEVFASEPGQPAKITGYAAMYDRLSEDLGGFRTVVAPGAFDKVLLDDCRLLINHDPNLLLGRTRSGTLRLWSDARGLAFEGEPPDSMVAAHYLASIRRGDMDGCSFTCFVDVDMWDLSGETPIRRLIEIGELLDIGPVSYPAFPDTSAVVRHSLEAARRAAAPTPRRSADLMRLGIALAR